MTIQRKAAYARFLARFRGTAYRTSAGVSTGVAETWHVRQRLVAERSISTWPADHPMRLKIYYDAPPRRPIGPFHLGHYRVGTGLSASLVQVFSGGEALAA